MRRGKRASLKANGWLFGLAVPAVVLFVLFSLMPYDRMVRPWPLGIRSDEVMFYQHYFDQRPGQHVEGHVEEYALSGADCDGGTLRFEGAGYSGDVQAAPLGAGWTVDFPVERPFQGKGSLALAPATLASLRVKYAQVIADSLGLQSPAVELVRLVRCGKDLGLFLAQERPTEGYVRRRMPFGNRLAPADSARRFDEALLSAVTLMACGEERTDLVERPVVVRDAVLGEGVPLYAMAAAATDTARSVSFRRAMATASNRQRVDALAERLRADSAAWSERLLAIDSLWVPVLAEGRNIGLVQAEVDRGRQDLLRAFFHPDAGRLLGPEVADAAAPSLELDPWLKPFRTEPDTLRFVRGKYAIDHDLIIPEGMAVVLEKGTRWNLAPGVRVQVNGELHMRGTALNPVFIRPQDPSAPYGSICVKGDGRTRCHIRGLRISGGSEATFDGIRYGGMLGFHGVDLRMANSAVEECFGPAAIELAAGTVRFSDCSFTGARHGTLALARASGSIEGCGFNGGAGDAGTLRMDDCTVLIRNCTWNGAKPVALEAAYRSRVLVLGSTFAGGGTAIAATDSAAVHVDGSTFTGNATVYSLHRARPELGAPTVTAYTNTLEGNAREKDVDASSRFTVSDKRDPVAWSWFGARP